MDMVFFVCVFFFVCGFGDGSAVVSYISSAQWVYTVLCILVFTGPGVNQHKLYLKYGNHSISPTEAQYDPRLPLISNSVDEEGPQITAVIH